MKESIKAILVDDVEAIRSVLKKLLENFEKIVVVGEASNFEDALNLIEEETPDLLILDIDLNGLTSIDLLSKIKYDPMIIFVTSHSDYAIKAFEHNAVDFLLKPISLDRLTKAIEKVTNKWENAQTTDASEEDVETKFGPNHVILLNYENRLNFVKVHEITHIEAFGNYTKVYLSNGKMSVTYNSIRNWLNRLPEDMFIQIHRSTLVNLTAVTKIEKWANDTGRLYINDNKTPFEISRNYFFNLKKKYKM